MATHYYTTTTFLAFAINRHVYEGKHFVYVAADFYPYRSGNPKSSNPLLIYMDFYQPWKDADAYDKFILQHRLALRKGILAKQKDGVILSAAVAAELRIVADRIVTDYFYPVVYELDIDPLIAGGRVHRAASALPGSKEFLIHDLDEQPSKPPEFKVLFDNHTGLRFAQFRNPAGHFSSQAQAVGELKPRNP